MYLQAALKVDSKDTAAHHCHILRPQNYPSSFGLLIVITIIVLIIIIIIINAGAIRYREKKKLWQKQGKKRKEKTQACHMTCLHGHLVGCTAGDVWTDLGLQLPGRDDQVTHTTICLEGVER